MGLIGKGFLRSGFNALAQLAGYTPISIRDMHDLFTPRPTLINYADINGLRGHVDKTLDDLMRLSKQVNCTRAENMFMEVFLDIRSKLARAPSSTSYIYLKDSDVADLYKGKNGFLNLSGILRYATPIDRNASITSDQTASLLENSFLSSRLTAFSEKLHHLLEKRFSKNGDLETQFNPYGTYYQNIHEIKTWDQNLLPPSMTKIEIETLAALLHGHAEYDSEPRQRRKNLINGLDKIMDWIEDPWLENDKVAPEGLYDLQMSVHEIMRALNSQHDEHFDPRYILIPIADLVTLRDSAHIIGEAADIYAQNIERFDGRLPAGETNASIAEKLGRIAINMPAFLSRSFIDPQPSSARKPQDP